MTRFHGFQDVGKRPHLHHSAVEPAHGRHDAVGADGHEGQQFQEAGLGCSLHQRDDDGAGDGSHGQHLVQFGRADLEHRSVALDAENPLPVLQVGIANRIRSAKRNDFEKAADGVGDEGIGVRFELLQ